MATCPFDRRPCLPPRCAVCATPARDALARRLARLTARYALAGPLKRNTMVNEIDGLEARIAFLDAYRA